MQHIKVYDKNMKLKAFLENAFSVPYDQSFNEIWTAAFSLPFDDPKNNEISAFDRVEIFDGEKRIGLFRIIPTETVRNEEEKTITYKCEHVLATLLDDVLFSYHQLSNYVTRDVLVYILSKQETPHWQLGTVEFTKYFHYSWEHENLITALFSVPNPFDEEYQWTWDDSSYPWTLNLVKVTDEITGELRYRKNLNGIKKIEDPTGIITRIYPLGYGEGVNQLNIMKVNPTGLPYIDAEPEFIEEYGLHPYIWVDRRFENADALFNSGKAILDKNKRPKATYFVEALDYELIDPYKLEKYEVGKLVRIYDDDLGIVELQRVKKKSKPDTKGNPYDMNLEIGDLLEDLGTTQADLERRQKINETYAQGATNIDSHNYNDNCDATHPAIIKFYLPSDLVNINTMTLSYETEAFRAYERATKGGGGTTATSTSGGGTTATSSSGGASTQTSSSGGGVSTSTESGGGTTTSTPAGGNHYHKLFNVGSPTPTTLTKREYYTYLKEENIAVAINVESAVDGNMYTFEADGNHTHDITVPAHTHQFSVPAHTHQVSTPAHTHQVTIPDHSHQVTLPDHIHEMDFGIYELNESASSVVVKVDGQEIPGLTATSINDFNIIPYLSKDSSGKVRRGQWHKVEIFPDELARINANIISRLFIQSRIGGTF